MYEQADRAATAAALRPKPDSEVIRASVEEEHDLLMKIQRAKEQAVQKKLVSPLLFFLSFFLSHSLALSLIVRKRVGMARA